MAKALLPVVLIVLLSASGFAQQARLIIREDGRPAVVEKLFERELTAGKNTISFDALTSWAVTESLTLREASDKPEIRVLSLVLRRNEDHHRLVTPVWTVHAPETKTYSLKLNYMIRDISWDGIYNIFFAPDMRAAAIQATLAIRNFTEERLENLRIVLSRKSSAPRETISSTQLLADESYPAVFPDMDLIVLGDVAFVEASATTNILLADIAALPIEPFLQYDTYLDLSGGHVPAPSGVWWRAETANIEEHGLGVGLPAGSCHIFEDTPEGAVLHATTTIKATPPGELVGFYLAEEPGITVSLSHDSERDRRGEVKIIYKILLSSNLAQPREVRVFLHPRAHGQDFEITEASDLYKTHDDGRVEFRVEVSPDEDRAITYEVE